MVPAGGLVSPTDHRHIPNIIARITGITGSYGAMAHTRTILEAPPDSALCVFSIRPEHKM